MDLIGKFESGEFGTVSVLFGKYPYSGEPQVLLELSGGEALARLSVDLTDQGYVVSVVAERPGCFFAKTYSENREIAAEALASGLFMDTGRRVKLRFVDVPIWAIRKMEE
ncbi:MAG: hypothetical protein H7831_17965 [Magnetococcus sp. WYHC-3]